MTDYFHPDGTVTDVCLSALAASDSDVLRAIAAEVIEWRERDIRIRAQAMPRGLPSDSVEWLVEKLLREHDQMELLRKVVDGEVKMVCREQLEERLFMIGKGWKI